jgi:hypothetical protein
MNHLKTSSFIAGYKDLYSVVRDYPELRMVPIEHVETVRNGLYHLGYDFRIRYRGPHGKSGETLKENARAFTVYIYSPVV